MLISQKPANGTKMNLTLIDTSVWIEYFRGNSQIIITIHWLLDNNLAVTAFPVRMELLIGARNQERKSITEAFGGLLFCDIQKSAWEIAEKWIIILREKGITPSLIDVLLVAVAKENLYSFWTLDKDFEPMFKYCKVQKFDSLKISA